MCTKDFQILSAGIATIALIGAGIGGGIIFSGLLTGISRNPSIQDDLFSKSILAFALVEASALFALMMSFIFLFAL